MNAEFGKGTFGRGEVGKRRRKFGEHGEYPLPRKTEENALSRQFVAVKPVDKTEALPRTVQGRPASDLEERVYRMLKRLGWTDRNIQFQTPVLGGRRPGGQVLDFVLYGFGAVTVIFVNGEYWHGIGLKADITKFKEDQVKNVFPAAIVLSLFTGELATDEIAFYTLQRLVGRGS